MTTSWTPLRKVGLEFIETAEKTYRVEKTVKASRADVWRAFADPATWKHWFPGVDEASYGDSVEPFGVGTFRESLVAGERYEEIMVSWDEGVRWGYYIERATLPVAKAQLEINEFEDCDGGTLVRWILATDPLQDLTYMADGTPFAEFMDGLFGDAMKALDAFIVAGGLERS